MAGGVTATATAAAQRNKGAATQAAIRRQRAAESAAARARRGPGLVGRMTSWFQPPPQQQPPQGVCLCMCLCWGKGW